ncbi:MAG: arginine--tRNA ligase, partial [Armatimonadetes bacterium]|nr:arginine--tRNA ligase [Armatimonadota bacterium]
GNTAPYMLYAYARVQSIGRRAGLDLAELPADLSLRLEHPSEIALAKQLLEFAPTVRQVAAELRPDLLTDYLYGLSRAFSTFYDRERGVRVVDATPEAVRLSRLRLCDLTARTLRIGLELLGIPVVEQM